MAIAGPRRTLILGALALLVVGGCATTAPMGEPLGRPAGSPGYRFKERSAPRRLDDTLFILTLSGGGNRAAALSYGVLEQLAADPVVHDGQPRRLLDEIDVISAVSGGSVLATALLLHGEGLFPGFRRDYLERDTERDMWRAMFFSPRNWVKLASSRYARGDLLADHLDRRLFRGSTFSALMNSDDLPFLVINSTDLSVSGRFQFTQDWFDVICVDLATFPLARAVAASAAYPVMLTPLSIKNRAGECGYQVPSAAGAAGQQGSASRETALLKRFRSYQDAGAIQFLHLADGAMADNLGIRSAIDALVGLRDLQQARQELGLERIRRVVILSVDGSGNQRQEVARRRRPPGVVDMARLAGAALIDEATAENRALLREQLDRLARTADAGDAPPPTTYWINVALEGIPDVDRRERLLAIPTSLAVKPAKVAELICSGHELLADSQEYQRLLRDLQGGAPKVERCPEAVARD